MTLTKELIERIAEAKRSLVEANGVDYDGPECPCRTCEISRLFLDTYLHKNVAYTMVDELIEKCKDTEDAARLIVTAIAIGFEFAEQLYESSELEKLTK